MYALKFLGVLKILHLWHSLNQPLFVPALKLYPQQVLEEVHVWSYCSIGIKEMKGMFVLISRNA